MDYLIDDLIQIDIPLALFNFPHAFGNLFNRLLVQRIDREEMFRNPLPFIPFVRESVRHVSQPLLLHNFCTGCYVLVVEQHAQVIGAMKKVIIFLAFAAMQWGV